MGYDATAARRGANGRERVAVMVKGYRHPVCLVVVHMAAGTMALGAFQRFLLVSLPGFTRAARDAVERDSPVTIELIGSADLRRWAQRLVTSEEGLPTRFVVVLTAFTRRLAQIVARDSRELDNMEWRDIERLMREVFEGIGFDAELTPASKDGGKDVILTVVENRRRRCFLVELKHWRSGKGVGIPAVRKFVKVVATERREGGLFLSTYGYSKTAFEGLSQIDRTRVRFGTMTKIHALCQTYVKAEQGLWTPTSGLPELLFSDTE